MSLVFRPASILPTHKHCPPPAENGDTDAFLLPSALHLLLNAKFRGDWSRDAASSG